MSAELAARRTAAAAVLTDIEREVVDDKQVSAATWAYRCGRLSHAVRSLLEITGQEMSCDDKGSVKSDNLHQA